MIQLSFFAHLFLEYILFCSILSLSKSHTVYGSDATEFSQTWKWRSTDSNVCDSVYINNAEQNWDFCIKKYTCTMWLQYNSNNLHNSDIKHAQ